MNHLSVHSTLYSVQCTLVYIVHCTMYSVYCTVQLYNIHCTLRCTVYNVRCTVYMIVTYQHHDFLYIYIVHDIIIYICVGLFEEVVETIERVIMEWVILLVTHKYIKVKVALQVYSSILVYNLDSDIIDCYVNQIYTHTYIYIYIYKWWHITYYFVQSLFIIYIIFISLCMSDKLYRLYNANLQYIHYTVYIVH